MNGTTVQGTLIALAAIALLALGGFAGETGEPEKTKPDAGGKDAPGTPKDQGSDPEGGGKEEVKELYAGEKGEVGPDFTGTTPGKTLVKLSDYAGKWVVLEWINHGCPFVKKHYNSGNMQALQKQYTDKGVVWLSICSSAPGKQGHMSAEEWKRVNEEKGSHATEVVLDPEGKIGKLYKAGRTPHMVVLDPKRRFVFEGAIDDKPRAFAPDLVKGAKNYVRAVLDAVMKGEKSPFRKVTAYGCSVKYAQGHRRVR